MIYVTGDFHGDIDRFSARDIKRLKRKDYLIILGDFGFIWNGSKEEQKLLKWIGKRRFTTLFIEGTHDNYSLFENYPEVDFAGGRARHISGRLYKLTRGHIFNLDDKKIFAFGGGETIDKDVADE
ncbi:MAG: metallophosphoesterase, partial [Oscillospiraceae bacterium]|nr:metallophosphoesterase [Oscillospiraceae bacterium]